MSALAAALLLQALVGDAVASSSPAFDRDCPAYYAQELDPDISPDQSDAYCACLATEAEAAGLGTDALDFFARTYSDDLTTFIHEYPKGDAWMDESFRAEPICKGRLPG
jgi:hypothetical protein